MQILLVDIQNSPMCSYKDSHQLLFLPTSDCIDRTLRKDFITSCDLKRLTTRFLSEAVDVESHLISCYRWPMVHGLPDSGCWLTGRNVFWYVSRCKPVCLNLLGNLPKFLMGPVSNRSGSLIFISDTIRDCRRNGLLHFNCGNVVNDTNGITSTMQPGSNSCPCLSVKRVHPSSGCINLWASNSCAAVVMPWTVNSWNSIISFSSSTLYSTTKAVLFDVCAFHWWSFCNVYFTTFSELVTFQGSLLIGVLRMSTSWRPFWMNVAGTGNCRKPITINEKQGWLLFVGANASST